MKNIIDRRIISVMIHCKLAFYSEFKIKLSNQNFSDIMVESEILQTQSSSERFNIATT